MAQMAQNNLTRHHEKISKITKQDANLIYPLYNTPKRKTVVDVTHKQRNDLCLTIGQQSCDKLVLDLATNQRQIWLQLLRVNVRVLAGP